jgi:ketosteroid isomerase-like protein
MTDDKLEEMVESVLSAWNSQDVERVVGCYTEDLVYLDPNTRGSITRADDFRRYLRKLFAVWKMEWHLKEAHPLRDSEGGAFLWRAVIQKADGDKKVEIEGMDLIVLEGDKISRNEVYFDRAALAVFMGG